MSENPLPRLPLILLASLIVAAGSGIFLRKQQPESKVEILILPETVLEVQAPSWERDATNE